MTLAASVNYRTRIRDTTLDMDGLLPILGHSLERLHPWSGWGNIFLNKGLRICKRCSKENGNGGKNHFNAVVFLPVNSEAEPTIRLLFVPTPLGPWPSNPTQLFPWNSAGDNPKPS